MSSEHIETVIIGAGQAGLSTAYHLQQLGRSCVVLAAESRVGDGWREQWDSLTLFTPAWADGLDGMPFPAPRWHTPGKDEFADYLQAYATRFRLPVQTSTRAERLTRSHDDAYLVTTPDGTIKADNVVVATGTFGRTPFVPDFADQLDPGIRQLHSSEYRRPEQLASGAVLVVGASHSGCDIAYEAAATHETVLVGRDNGQIPIPFTSPLVKVVLPVMLFAFGHVLTRRTSVGRKEMHHFRHGGGPRLRVQTADLERRHVDWVRGRMTGVQDGRPVLDNGRSVDASTVVWCTGFRQAFEWIDLPVFADDGWPRELRGVVDEAPGLYFAGLCFQSAAVSMTIHGAGHDAEYVARHIAARSRDRANQAVAV